MLNLLREKLFIHCDPIQLEEWVSAHADDTLFVKKLKMISYLQDSHYPFILFLGVVLTIYIIEKDFSIVVVEGKMSNQDK